MFENVTPGRLLKAELHAHSDLDPADGITHTTRELIDRAADLGYHALAVTLHDRYFDAASEAGYAGDRGVILLSGIERTIRGKHLLLINFSAACADVTEFEDLARLRDGEPHGLVVAPHPLYPNPSSLGRELLDQYAHLVDAVEINAMYTRRLNFNRAAIRWARHARKPVVGNSDLHVLDQLNRTYSLIETTDRSPDGICAAIRKGRVEIRTTPMSLMDAAWTFARMVAGGVRGRARHLFNGR